MGAISNSKTISTKFDGGIGKYIEEYDVSLIELTWVGWYIPSLTQTLCWRV